MNVKTILAKATTMLYRESQLKNHDGTSNKVLVNDILKSLKINNTNGINDEDDKINGLKTIVESLCERQEPISYTELNQQLKLVCDDDTTLFESIQDSVFMDLPQEELKKITSSYSFELRKWKRRKEVISDFDAMMYKLRFKPDEIDDADKFLKRNINLIQEKLEYSEEEIPGIICELDLDELEGVEAEFQKLKDESSGKRVIKTPWQAMNRMLQGGLRLGQLTVIGGLAHNNKSGVLRGLFCGANIYNNPMDLMSEEGKSAGKKPMNVFISLEDDVTIILANLYQMLKGNLDNVVITNEEKKNLDVKEASRYIQEKLQSTGYKVKIIRASAGEWGYSEVMNKIMQYESEGYEIHGLYMDYVNLLNKEGCIQGTAGEDIRDLFRKLKNFCAPRDICLVSPHQLSSDALQLKRDGKRDMVKIISIGSYYDGSKRLSQEPELEIFIDKVVVDGIAYMAFSRGKHRGQNDTEEKDKYFIIPFSAGAGLFWDIYSEDISLTRFGATRNANGEEEAAFYDFEL